MAKSQMKYYRISDGKKIDIDEDSMMFSKFGTYKADKKELDFVDEVSLTDEKKLEYLKVNPFFNCEKEITYPNLTLEDYICNYKNNDVYFGELVNNQNLTVGKKKKIVKSVMKDWRKEFIERRKDTLETLSKNMVLSQDLNYINIRTKIFVLYSLGLLLLSVFVFLPQSFFDIFSSVGFIQNTKDSFVQLYKEHNGLLQLGYVTIGVTGITLISCLVYNIMTLSCNNYSKKHSQLIKTTSNNLNRQFKKKFNYAYNYYMKNINKNNRYIEPMKMSNLQLETNVLSLDNINQVIIDDTVKIKKTMSGAKTFNIFIRVINVLMLITFVGFVFYLMI